MTVGGVEEYVPERDEEEEEDAERVLGELEEDQTETEEVEEEVAQEVEVMAAEMVRRAAVVEAVRDMLARRSVDIGGMEVLSDQEREALQFLQAVIEGRTQGGAFMYAERRLEQLNLLLADLQPLMAVGMVEGLDDSLAEVIDGFQELRHHLELLEEAEDEIRHVPEKKKEGEEDDDDDDDKPEDGDDGEAGEAEPADKPKSSLAEESTAAAAAAEPDKKQGLWGRLWNRGKKPDEGGGGGGGA